MTISFVGKGDWEILNPTDPKSCFPMEQASTYRDTLHHEETPSRGETFLIKSNLNHCFRKESRGTNAFVAKGLGETLSQ